MKFTGVVASLAIASTASALVIPNLQDANISPVLERLDGVIGNVAEVLTQFVGESAQLTTGVVGNTVETTDSATDVADSATTTVVSTVFHELTVVREGLTSVRGELTNLINGEVCQTVGGAVAPVGSFSTTTISSVASVVGGVQEVSSLSDLAGDLVGRIQGGEVDADGLTALMTVIGGNRGLENLNTALANVQ